MPWETTDQYHRHRVKDPGSFEKGSFVTQDFGKSGIKAVMGRLKGEKTLTVQSILFPVDDFSIDEAKKWMKDHPDVKASDLDAGTLCFMYDSWEDAPAYVKRHGQKAAEKWVALVREKFSETKDEYASLKAANEAMGFSEMVDRWNVPGSRRAFVEIWPSFRAAGYYEVEFCHTGDWVHPEYGPIHHSLPDFRDAVRNFRDEPRVSPLDYLHGTDYGTKHDEAIAAGVLDDVWIEDAGGKRIADDVEDDDVFARLMTRWKITARANEYLEAGEYVGFSPTYHPNFSDKKTGKPQGFTILAGALTNRPWFDGQKPGALIAASERAAAWIRAAELRPGARFVLVCKEQGGTIEDKVAELGKLGFDVDTFYQGPGPATVQGTYQDQGRGHRGAGGGGSRTDAGDSRGGEGSLTVGGEMGRTAEERVRLAKTLKMAEAATDAEIDEKLSSLVALAEKAPKPGEVTIKAEDLAGLKEGADLARTMAKTAHEEKKKAVVGGAIDAIKIPGADREKWEKKFDEDPVGIEQLLAGLQSNPTYSGQEVGVGGTNEPGGFQSGARSATLTEIDRLAKEKMKDDPKLTIVRARNLVFGEKPSLYEAYRNENTRGGDR